MTREPTSTHPPDPAAPPDNLRLTFRAESDGDTRADLMDGDRSVSRLWIVPFTLRIGAATVRMDGIGGVGTEDDCRNRGYSRRVLEATVERMRQGDAALSMLYGIPDFYPKFGYATAGPDHFIELADLKRPAALPDGWKVRPSLRADLPAIHRLYEANTAAGVGCSIRPPSAHAWKKLAEPKEENDECRVVVDPQGQNRAYVWRARWHWYVEMLERDHPEALVLAEVMADGPAAADAALAACRLWAAEAAAQRSEPLRTLLLALPPSGPVAAAAMYQAARFVQRFVPCGSSMARVLDVPRLLESLTPELQRRLQAAGSRFTGVLRIRTEIGDAVVKVAPDGQVIVAADNFDSTATPDSREIRLPQSTLARLALGAFPPADLLARLPQPQDEETCRLVETLFPLRHPHMYLPDRF